MRLTLFVIGCALLSGCSQHSLGIETSREICLAWEDSLFLPSRQDTHETAVGLNQQEAIQAAACAEILEGV